MLLRKFVLLVVGGCLASSGVLSTFHPKNPVRAADDRLPTYATHVKPFLDRYCQECHGGNKPKGDFSLGKLQRAIDGPLIFEDWKLALDQINLGNMPPAKYKHQPPPKELETAARWMQTALRDASDRLTPKKTVLRRLNRTEYNNTLRDLLQIKDLGTYETHAPKLPADSFPDDPVVDGFDNNAAGLVMSANQLELYQQAALRSLDRATFWGAKPVSRTWRFPEDRVAMGGRGRNIGQEPNAAKPEDRDRLVLVSPVLPISLANLFKFVAPQRGAYQVTITAWYVLTKLWSEGPVFLAALS